jgi:hypothetical protein
MTEGYPLDTKFNNESVELQLCHPYTTTAVILYESKRASHV